MPFYTVTNPHELLTVEAPDFMTAGFSIFLLSEGGYGVVAEDPATLMVDVDAPGPQLIKRTGPIERLRPVATPSQQAMSTRFYSVFRMTFAEAADEVDPAATIETLESFCPGSSSSIRARLAHMERLPADADRREAWWTFTDSRSIMQSAIPRRAFFLAEQIRLALCPDRAPSPYYPPTKMTDRVQRIIDTMRLRQ